jgi:hypothetical protein
MGWHNDIISGTFPGELLVELTSKGGERENRDLNRIVNFYLSNN